MKKYIFGTSQFAEVLSSYIWTDSETTGKYIVDEKYLNSSSNLCNLISWEDFIKTVIPNDEIEIYIAIGYNNMNSIRESIYHRIKKYGYKIGTYIHPSDIVSSTSVIGEGCILLENVIIQPYVKCGVCNIFWSNVNLCHHTSIGNFNFFAASSAVLGRIEVGSNCFIGCNSTIKNEVKIADKTLIGAGAYCSQNTKEFEVVVPVRSVSLNKKSNDMKI